MLTLLITIVHQREMGWVLERKITQGLQDALVLRLRGRGQISGYLCCAHLFCPSPSDEPGEICEGKLADQRLVNWHSLRSWLEWSEPPSEKHGCVCRGHTSQTPPHPSAHPTHIPKKTETAIKVVHIQNPVPRCIWQRKIKGTKGMKEIEQGPAGTVVLWWSPMTWDGESSSPEPKVDARALQKMKERMLKIPVKWN